MGGQCSSLSRGHPHLRLTRFRRWSQPTMKQLSAGGSTKKATAGGYLLKPHGPAYCPATRNDPPSHWTERRFTGPRSWVTPAAPVNHRAAIAELWLPASRTSHPQSSQNSSKRWIDSISALLAANGKIHYWSTDNKAGWIIDLESSEHKWSVMVHASGPDRVVSMAVRRCGLHRRFHGRNQHRWRAFQSTIGLPQCHLLSVAGGSMSDGHIPALSNDGTSNSFKPEPAPRACPR